ncbi:transcriptional regulator, MerR family [Sporolactobacillus inulinus]|uniref:Transcriptional regulator, MerR family n=1 Tax=Sporolactobacillus inulinus TaxID=2078 RepID=A0A4Y1ZGU3_9BACL|nr:MerR family transcriptional regulator [Sporolactobacillus inulinus]GAY78239.1 transcriptional regulator, MerR family [Sporolactobacillus inulinus]
MKEYLKVGELAELTGLTIRTLRYYDQIQLFSPSEYTESGHRLYTKSDLTNLQQILSLKQMGLSLDDIKEVMEDREKNSAINIIETQIDRLRRDIQVQQNLLNELELTANVIRSKKMVSVKDITELLGAMKMYQEIYFSKQQLESIRDFYNKIDKDDLKGAEKKFKTILEEIRVEMDNGTPPSNAKVRKLAEEWRKILHSITINDSEIWKQAERFHQENPDNDLQYGLDGEIYQYIQGALKVSK